MPKSVLKDTLALAVYRSVSARMAPSAMWNLARATVNQVGMEHTGKSWLLGFANVYYSLNKRKFHRKF